MFRISLEESLRRNDDAGAAEEVAGLRRESAQFHRVMALLRNMKMEHGTCHPRERRACTHCNAQDDIEQMLSTHKGHSVVPA